MSSNKKSGAGGGAAPLKQGNLFSFFAKKKPQAAAPAAAPAAGKASANSSGPSASSSSSASAKAGTSATTTASKNNSSTTNAKTDSISSSGGGGEVTASRSTNPRGSVSSKQSALLAKVHVGCTVAVFWPDDAEYYPAKVTAKGRNSDRIYTLKYEDGEVETIDLATERFRFLGGAKRPAATAAAATASGNGVGGGNDPSKRRRINDDDDDDDSEEEFEFDDEADDDDEEDAAGKASKTANRRPSLSDGSEFLASENDEEMEDDDDSEEEFEFDEDEEDSEDEEALMVTDEDEEDGGYAAASRKKKKAKSSGGAKKKKTLKVTVDKRSRGAGNQTLTPPNRGSGGTTSAATGGGAGARANRSAPAVGGRPSYITPPNAGGSAAASASNVFADFAAFQPGEEDNAIAKKAASSMSPKRISQQSQPQSQSPMPPAGASSTQGRNPKEFVKPPLPVDKEVNPAGTHWHNHYKFLHPAHRRDGKGRHMNDPNYDPRTLRVDESEMLKVLGKSNLSPAQKQWWDIKKRYADTILLFKTGKFYEIFHMDADRAVEVLDFQYMKGTDAHAGFPEISYGQFTDRLVRAGLKVARVEQTETPDMLKERKQRTPRGQKKPTVMNREVCSVTTAGTRTFCFMDDDSALTMEGGMGGGSSGGIGPLIVIKETKIENTTADGDDGDEIKPVCEYGVVVVDAVRGAVTLGQFADDVLRSRMLTLLTNFAPSEILVEGGTDGASGTLMSLLKSAASTSPTPIVVERINQQEAAPKSDALNRDVRRDLERPSPTVRPWDVDEALAELHRKNYYPRASRKETVKYDTEDPSKGTARWPDVLRSCVEGGASLALSAFGAALFYLQRGLIDDDILTMGLVKAYIPPSTSGATGDQSAATELLQQIFTAEQQKESGVDVAGGNENTETTANAGSSSKPTAGSAAGSVEFSSFDPDQANAIAMEAQISHMALDGTTLANLEILANSHSNTVAGSLWSKINYTKSPYGSRLLRAWLLRPMFRKVDIDRRADAVEELVSGGPAAAMSEARAALAKVGDIERLLSRVHSMGGSGSGESAPGGSSSHPNSRAVLYEEASYTRRKVGDFAKLLGGLRAASSIPELFEGVSIESGLLAKLVRTQDTGGCFPSDLSEQLDWFFDNFNCKKAATGQFKPARGMDDNYDAACDALDRVKRDLEDYKHEMCSGTLPSSAKHAWKYVNTKEASKDKYLIELPASMPVPDDFFVKGKRGSGDKKINKYRSPVVEGLVQELEQAYDVVNAGKKRGMEIVFAKFDSMRSMWATAASATAMLDALGALAEASSQPGLTRPNILDCPPNGKPSVNIVQGRHPCVEITHSGADFVPNDLSLGGSTPTADPFSSGDDGAIDESRVLLLSGPNMGGKSTLLRQTCLITILAQIGCFVPAEECSLTPVDRIFTRLGASDRILLGQSTFFVELAETAAALRGATRRSLVIMDELGRGTSTFDGTAIASAAVKHLVERNCCLALFATHYHSLLEDWKDEASVRLGHMECVVEGGDDNGDAMDVDGEGEEEEVKNDHNITFLYTLGEGTCPKSFGINVARLAALPEEVLAKAKKVSADFEAEMNGLANHAKISPASAVDTQRRIQEAVASDNWSEVEKLWHELQN